MKINSPQQAETLLNEMTAKDDSESRHSEADNILCELLIHLGYSKIARAYKDAQLRVPFWYS